MNKIKNIVAFILLAVLVYSCGDDNSSSVDDFDHKAQAEMDKDSLTSFLKKYYFDTSIDSIKPLITGKIALFDDPNLKTITKDVTENEIDYTLYVYVINEGGKNSNGDVINTKGFPTVMDSILTNYQVWNIPRTDSISLQETGTKANWWNLGSSTIGAPSPIRGWAYGFSNNFKGGENITNNGPITYENGGKGILILPSGLAYPNGSLSSLVNQNLLFYIDLFDIVENTDHDNDGVPSIFEVPDDKDPRNNDTDGDFTPNYLDADDDGDGVLTKDEDTEKPDGNPANDFSDPNNPTLPDYLNPDITKSIVYK